MLSRSTLRWGAVVLTLGVCGALALAPRPALDNSIGAMLVDDSAPALRYARFKALFGPDEVVVLRATAPDRDALFARMVALEQTLAEHPEVAATLGPASAYEDELDVLLDADLGGWGELERLAPRFEGPLDGALDLVDFEAPAVRVYAFCRPGLPIDRRQLAAELAAARSDIEGMGGALHAAGPPLLNLALDDAGQAVERVALPALVGVCVLLMIALTRSLRVSLAVLLPVGLGVLGAEGLLWVAGRPGDIIVNIAKPLLFVLLLATGLHIVVAWQDLRRSGVGRHAAPWIAARRKAGACALALGTTALGFSSLLASEVPSIRAFGALAAAGLGLGLPLMLLGVPAALQLVGGEAAPKGGQWIGSIAARAIGWSLGHRRTAIGVAALIVAVGAALVPALPTSTGGVHYFDDDARIRQDYEALAAAGLGLSTVELMLTGERLDGEASLEAIDAFARQVEALPGARRVVGLPLFLREANWRVTKQDVVPRGSMLEDALASEALAGFVAGEGRHQRLSVLIDHLDAAELDALYAAVRGVFAASLGAQGVTLEITGHHELVVHAQATLVETLLWSLLGTLLLIELIVMVALRSWRMALAALLPTTLPVCLNFALMWTLGIPLDLGTCMTGAIAIGIAVDDALHFMVAWRRESPMQTARGTGRALVLTSVVIAAGFASLLFADFAPTARFGLLSAIAMASALLADLLVLPALLGWLAPKETAAA